jgi:hypothetical protein
MTMMQLLAADLTPSAAEAAAATESESMLLRGFTAVHDAGGPLWGLKAGIDFGEVSPPAHVAIGPRH